MTDPHTGAPRCLLCGSTKAKILSERDSFGFKVRYYLCQTCGFVYQNPGESAASDPEFYEETYRKLYQATEEPTAKDLRQQKLRAEFQLRLLQGHGVCRLNRALDIGASSGTLLQTLHEAYGAEAVGVEPGNAYRKLAENKGFTLYQTLEQLEAADANRFDLVTIMHVLEHFEDPLGVLVEIRQRLLDPNGVLLVEVPNFYAHESYELAHLSCFTAHTLSEMLKKAGFKVAYMGQHGYPRSETLNLYLSALAYPLKDPSETYQTVPERGVPLKRAIGMTKGAILTKLMPAKTWLPLEEKA